MSFLRRVAFCVGDKVRVRLLRLGCEPSHRQEKDFGASVGVFVPRLDGATLCAHFSPKIEHQVESENALYFGCHAWVGARDSRNVKSRVHVQNTHVNGGRKSISGEDRQQLQTLTSENSLRNAYVITKTPNHNFLREMSAQTSRNM